MKAESLKERPNYALYKQNDIVNFFNLQLPRWLVEDSRYKQLSIEAKFIYTLLFNRFQLSKHNGWINDNGEVFVIYSRKELAEQSNISEKRVSAAMTTLREFELIWERRCGRGFANQIYLASVQLSLKDSIESKGGPFDAAKVELEEIASDYEVTESDCAHETKEDNTADLRTDKMEFLNCVDKEQEPTLSTVAVDNSADNVALNCNNRDSFPQPTTKMDYGSPKPNFKNRQNSASKGDFSSLQEPLKTPPSYLDLNNKYYNKKYISQSMSCQYNDLDNETLMDAEAVSGLINQSELQILEPPDAEVIKDAIERLYYTRSIRVGNAVYPNERIRANLYRLNIFIVQDTIAKLTKNLGKVRNSSAYVVTVLFNTIMESGSDLIVDPYLNFLRGKSQ